MKSRLSSAETKLVSGSPYWSAHHQTHRPNAPLRGEAPCDVAVIGGGITGALVCHQLAKSGIDTVLLEKHRLGSGSTSASTALISYEFDELLTTLGDAIGKSRATKAYQLCHEAVSYLADLVKEIEDPCDYDKKVSVRVSNDPSHAKVFESEARARNKEGLTVDILTEAELTDKYGVSARLGLVSNNAAQIDPLKLTHRLIARSKSAGLRVYEHTKVTSFEETKGHVRLQTSDGASIQAKRVVFATGYESEKYLGFSVGELNTDYCMISHPLRNMEKIKKCHLVEHAENYLYASTFGDRVMVGIEGRSFQFPGERTRRLSRKTKEIVERIEKYLPGHQFNKDYHWGATFANSKDSLPYLGQSKLFPRAWFVLGYGGNGIASSTMLSFLVRDIVLGKSNPDTGLFAFDR